MVEYIKAQYKLIAGVLFIVWLAVTVLLLLLVLRGEKNTAKEAVKAEVAQESTRKALGALKASGESSTRLIEKKRLQGVLRAKEERGLDAAVLVSPLWAEQELPRDIIDAIK